MFHFDEQVNPKLATSWNARPHAMRKSRPLNNNLVNLVDFPYSTLVLDREVRQPARHAVIPESKLLTLVLPFVRADPNLRGSPS